MKGLELLVSFNPSFTVNKDVQPGVKIVVITSQLNTKIHECYQVQFPLEAVIYAVLEKTIYSQICHYVLHLTV